MRFAVMGAGDIGSRYGVKLMRAGHDVTFIARNRTYQRIKTEGLSVSIIPGTEPEIIQGVSVSDNPSEVGPVDAIVFAVKTYQLEEAAKAIKPMIGADTVVIPLQNGVTAGERIAAIVGKEHALGFATWNPNAIGELGVPVSDRVRKLAAALVKADWDVEAVDDIRIPLWSKTAVYASLAPFIVSRLNPGEGLASPEVSDLHRTTCAEVASVVQAEGFDITAQRLIEFAQNIPTVRQSMTIDLEAGRPLELEELIGIVVHKAAERGIPVPVLETCYKLLKPHEHGLVS